MGLAECIEIAENSYLQVLVSADCGAQAEGLSQRLTALGESTSYQKNGRWLVSVLATEKSAWDYFLVSLQYEVDGFNKREGGRAELVETRLMAPGLVPRSSIGSFALLSGEREVAGVDEIWLDSSHAFGSGNHPSTRLAVLLLEEASADTQPGCVLDVGCGSGLLSLISARLGAPRVVGVDVCLDALKAARHNVIRNDLSRQINITNTPLHSMAESFDLILANVTLSVFYSLHDEIKRLRAGSGRLIVSGLQGRQVDEAFERLVEGGWFVGKKVHEGKWQAMLCSC